MIAITGASGLLGSFITQRLLEGRASVVGLKRPNSNMTLVREFENQIQWIEGDVTDPHSLDHAFQGVNTVVHSAGLVSFNPRKSKELFQINTEGTRHVVNACLKAGVPNLVFVSSVAALGRQKDVHHITEESRWVEGPMNSDYAKSKYLAELEVFRGQEEGLNVAMVNPSVILAPGDWNRSSAQLFKYVWNERKFYTNGNLNFVDVRDVAEAIWKLSQRKLTGDRYIINGGYDTFSNVFLKVAHRFNKKSPFIKVNRSLAGLAATIEEVQSYIFQYEPVITRQSVKMTKGEFYYNNKKSIDTLQLSYKSLEETLDWCCAVFLERYNINK